MVILDTRDHAMSYHFKWAFFPFQNLMQQMNVAQNLIMPYVKYPVILVAESFTVRLVMTCIKRKRSATALFNALCVVRSLKPQRQKNLTNATLTNAPYAMNM